MKSRLLITRLDAQEAVHNRLDKNWNKKLEQIFRVNLPGSYENDQEVRKNH